MSPRRDPAFTHHALQRARERFPWLRAQRTSHLIQRLTVSLLNGDVVAEDDVDYDTVLVASILHRGSHSTAPIQFVVDPADGTVVTVFDPRVGRKWRGRRNRAARRAKMPQRK